MPRRTPTKATTGAQPRPEPEATPKPELVAELIGATKEIAALLDDLSRKPDQDHQEVRAKVWRLKRVASRWSTLALAAGIDEGTRGTVPSVVKTVLTTLGMVAKVRLAKEYWAARGETRSHPETESTWRAAELARRDAEDVVATCTKIAAGLEAAKPAAGSAGEDSGGDPQAAPAGPTTRALVHEGATWRLMFDGKSYTVPGSKGMHYLATVLAEPGRAFGCLELCKGSDLESESTQEVLDAEAIRNLRQKANDIEADLAEAKANNDLGQIERLTNEWEAIQEELGKNVSATGRRRTFDDPAERARKAVSIAIKRAIAAIKNAHPEAGVHLVAAVKTGDTIVYQPTDGTSWTVLLHPK